MTQKDDEPAGEIEGEREGELARVLDTRVDCEDRNIVDSGNVRSTELAGPISALEKLRDALAPRTAASPAPEVPGFALRGELGRGGMGVVMRAYDSALEREVAIKFLSTDLSEHVESKERFLREARALAKVRHPNLVAVHAAGEVDGRPYFAMELVEGTALDRAIAKARKGDGGVLPVDARARSRVVGRLFSEIADALAAVHRAGLMHRDVKPANILIAGDGTARLADFGISADRRRGEEGSDAGTLRYLAPERVAGGPSEEDPRIDIYALGLSMIEALVLAPVFTQKTAPALRAAILAGAQGGGESAAGADARLLAIARRAASRNAADRFADAASMAAAIRDHLNTKNTILTKPVLIGASVVLLVSAGFGIARVTGAFGQRPQRQTGPVPREFNNIGPRDGRDPRMRIGRGERPLRMRIPGAEREELATFMPFIKRFRDASERNDWPAFERALAEFDEIEDESPPAQVARAWSLALGPEPDFERAREIVNGIPKKDEVPPIDKLRKELLDHIDGSPAPVFPPRRPPRGR